MTAGRNGLLLSFGLHAGALLVAPLHRAPPHSSLATFTLAPAPPPPPPPRAPEPEPGPAAGSAPAQRPSSPRRASAASRAISVSPAKPVPDGAVEVAPAEARPAPVPTPAAAAALVVPPSPSPALDFSPPPPPPLAAAEPDIQVPTPSAGVKVLRDWARDPYQYQREMDGTVPGRPQIRNVNPMALPGDPSEKQKMIYLPLITGRMGGPAPPKRIIPEQKHNGPGAKELLARRLQSIWQDDRRSPAERRALLFVEWDECADTGTGRSARAAILAFIRAHLPASSPDAYPAAELDALNARRASPERFAPYD